MKGYVQVYTGEGKGKTTAALGLAIRALGAGMSVYIAQFAKGMEYSEIKALKRFAPQLVLHQWGRDCFIRRKPEEEDIELAKKGFDHATRAMTSGEYDLIIMDEANIASYYDLITVDDLIAFIDKKPEAVELVITGRKADERVMERADLVTRMVEVKHYYQQGVEARKGIES